MRCMCCMIQLGRSSLVCSKYSPWWRKACRYCDCTGQFVRDGRHDWPIRWCYYNCRTLDDQSCCSDCRFCGHSSVRSLTMTTTTVAWTTWNKILITLVRRRRYAAQYPSRIRRTAGNNGRHLRRLNTMYVTAVERMLFIFLSVEGLFEAFSFRFLARDPDRAVA